MNRTNEIIQLCEKHLELSTGLLPKLLNLQRRFRSEIKKYLFYVKRNDLIDEEYFNKYVIYNNDLIFKLSEELKEEKEELFQIIVRLWNLHNANHQINGSDFHFKYLVENSREPLKRAGFNIKNEQEYKVEYINTDDIIISLVYQRFDPPEVWIRRSEDKGNMRIGSFSEQYFDKELKIFKNYAGQGMRFFNDSSFDYYDEFLKSYLTKIVKLENFVAEINNCI